MHLDRFREADRLADSPFDPRASRQMLPLDLLGVPFARAVYLSVQMACVRAPMIGIKTGEPEGLQPCFAL